MSVMLKSAYLSYHPEDGTRYLVETFWPEGVETYGLSPFRWIHEIAPSYYMKQMALREQWSPEQFREEYRQELQKVDRYPWFQRVLHEAKRGIITLLHNSRKKYSIFPEDSTAYYLKEFLEEALL